MFNIWVNQAVVTTYVISIVIRLRCDCETTNRLTWSQLELELSFSLTY